ncbi:MAG: peptidoglycan recognition family protein [Planctomycetota bacterium]
MLLLLLALLAPTTVPATQPAIVPAAAWGSTPANFPDDYLHEPTTVLLHHAGVDWVAGTDPAVKIKNLQTWGMRERGWHDVPYHFLIAPDGRVFEGRALRYRPDTNTDFDTAGYVNVQLWGNFDTQRVSRAQLQATVTLVAHLADTLDMPTEKLVAHSDVAATGCPGVDFYRYLDGGPLIGWIDQARAGQTPSIELLPPLEDGPTQMIPDAP